ncbi:hypothetical protein [Thermodesulforhabdus norvegica]|uniref:ParB-like catalytic effector domain-containing protein n=1 Tax=Thermodesulforhabdus norvegica TaxID=39841 RepID=A0A1I4SVV9_9BACT|nr:hypothetical protein [Thermodesulforhabdus norvegica]SFM68582.1 hypothetical protein SAMN05660836_01194 [Thermodesulforhabdus norvegica]
MKIRHIEHHGAEELITRLRKVTLLKRPEVRIYESCTISLEKISTSSIYPTQRYVLLQELTKVRELQWALQEHGYDMFQLNGYLNIWIDDSTDPITLLPPVVEESIERDGRVVVLINDGMHRLYLAHRQWIIPQVVFIRGVPKEYPYYAYPNPFQWDGIDLIDELPEGYIKKWHRIRDYHSLYRNFNSAFSNVGAPRGRFYRDGRKE